MPQVFFSHYVLTIFFGSNSKTWFLLTIFAIFLVKWRSYFRHTFWQRKCYYCLKIAFALSLLFRWISLFLKAFSDFENLKVESSAQQKATRFFYSVKLSTLLASGSQVNSLKQLKRARLRALHLSKLSWTGWTDWTELLNNKLHGLSPPGGLVSPSGGFASLLFDQRVPYYSQRHLADRNAICILHRSDCAWLCCSLSQCLNS